jgi:hypothetical protein
MIDLVCGNCLRDTASFSVRHSCTAKRIQKRSLSVINVSHDCDNGRTRLKILRGVIIFNESLGDSAVFVIIVTVECKRKYYVSFWSMDTN